MPKYKLTGPHYLNDAAGNGMYLEEGTVVGDGTTIPFNGRPSMFMEGLDDEGKKRVEARMKTAVNPIDAIPIVGAV